MYEDFTVRDRFTGEQLHCLWKGTVVAIATRHADATDIRFAVNGKPVWIALPNLAWVEQKRRNGKVITDYLAAQLARQATATLAEVRGTAAVLPGSHAGSRAGAPAFGTRQLARLPGCLSRVAAGRAVLLVNLARFSGSPATVIVTAAAGQAAEQVWVVGPGCSGSASDVLAHQQLPGRRAAGG